MAEDLRYIERQLIAQPEEDDEFNLLEIFSTIKRRWLWFGLTFGTVLGGVILATLMQTRIFQAEGRLLIKSDTTASDLLGLAEQFGALDSTSSKSNPVETEIQILLSPPLQQQVIDQLDLRDGDGLPLSLDAFEKNITAGQITGADVIEVTYKDPNPKLSAEVVNQLMSLYLKNNLDINRSQSVAAKEFIGQQLPGSNKRRQQAQSRLRKFKERHQIVEPVAEAGEAIEGIASLQKDIITTRAKLQDVQKREIHLRSKLGGISSEKAIASGSVSSSQRLQQGIRSLEEAEDALAVAEETLTPNHPDLLAKRETVASIRRNLESRLSQSTDVDSGQDINDLESSVSSVLADELVQVETQAEGIRQRLGELESAYRQQTSRTLSYPELEEEFAQLSLDVEVATLAYTSLYESLQKAQIAENQNIGNVRVLHQAAEPIKPISPRLILSILMGGVLGTLLGSAMALLAESRDLRLRNLEDVRRIYNYTLLGAIPDFSTVVEDAGETRANNLFVRDRPRSMISETYRMINTNLKFSRSDNLQVIVVSSGMPGEGKSSTLANIALAMAELGNQVILIDADMRLPSQHQVWELPNRKGLSHVPIENDESFTRLPVIPENDNLDIMPAGALPPNPTSLLDSKRFEKLIMSLRGRYDYILIDAPPITVASDALLISQFVDGLILIARPGKLNRAAANVAVNMIRQAQVNVLGVIGNAIRPKNETNSTEYYQQSYYGKATLDSDAEDEGAKADSKSLSSKALSLLGRSK